MSKNTPNLADEITRFIQLVSGYIFAGKSCDILMTMPREPGRVYPNYAAELSTADGAKHEAGAKVRDAGTRLAEMLEAAGHDASSVLAIVHCTGAHGGGPAYVLSRWETWRVELARAAIQLRTTPASKAAKRKPHKAGRPPVDNRETKRRLDLVRQHHERPQGEYIPDFCKRIQIHLQDMKSILRWYQRHPELHSQCDITT